MLRSSQRNQSDTAFDGDTADANPIPMVSDPTSLPDQPPVDSKATLQAILRRTLFAVSGGALLSVIVVLMYLHGSLRFSAGELTTALVLFWLVNIVFLTLVATRRTINLKDPALTMTQMVWASFSLLFVAYFLDEGRELVLMLQLLAMLFGAFHLSLRQFLGLSAFCSAGYGVVIVASVERDPGGFAPFTDLLTWGVYTSVLVAFSVLGAEISRLRQTLRHRNKDLAEARDNAEAANRAKGEFLGMLSHEIRTPLNALVGMPDVLDRAQLSDEERQYVASSRRASSHLLSLVGSMLDLSRLEGGQVKLEPERFALLRQLEELTQLMRYNAEEQGLSFIAEFDPQLPPHVVGDASRLREVLVQLLSNAIKFTDAGQIRLSVASKGQPANGTRTLEFSVSDTGIGIPADKLCSLFAPFTQADGSISRRHGGAGLGLAIARHLVDLLGGTLNVQSDVDKGSTFSFTIDLDVAPAQPTLAAVSEPGETPRVRSPAKRVRLLAVDDSLDNRLLLQALLKRLNVDLSLAENGLEAVERIRDEDFDLVLMDIHMPVKDGVTATREIREFERKNDKTPTPIIALTADISQATDEQACVAGFDRFIFKPVSKDELRKLLVEQFGEQVLGA